MHEYIIILLLKICLGSLIHFIDALVNLKLHHVMKSIPYFFSEAYLEDIAIKWWSNHTYRENFVSYIAYIMVYKQLGNYYILLY